MMLIYIMNKKKFIQNLFCHLNLGNCVTDILARLCTMQQLYKVPVDMYQQMRKEIVQYAINALDHYGDDELITSQIMDLFSTIVKKCYIMVDARSFFEMMLSPFIFQPLLEFTFEGGENTKQGAEFLKLFFYNLFVSEPQDAIIETMETNFGYSLLNCNPEQEEEKEEKE